jgi:subtilisin family serine protease
MTTEKTLGLLAEEPARVSERKVWIYFTDKNIFDVDAYQLRLQDVRAGLHPHAAARRAKAMPDLVDFHDIPVYEGYISQLAALGIEIVHESRWLNSVSVRASLEILEEVRHLPFVQKLEPVRSYGRPRPIPPSSASPVPGSSQGADIFDYGDSHDQLAEIGVVEAHNAGYTGAGVIVAMLDTGFDYDHPAFQHILDGGRLLDQWDFVNDDGNVQNEGSDHEFQHVHGTATWSVLAGFVEGTLIGPAFGASFLLYKTEDYVDEAPIEEDNWATAAERSDQLGADVISTSLGYKDWYTYEDMDGNTAVTTIAADIAVGRGIVVCTSAGNEGTQDWYYIIAPADADSIIAVGAVDWFNEVAGFSSHGPTYDGRTKPEVVARGVDVWSAFDIGGGDLYGYLNGTSMACPLVAGSAALVIEVRPGWTPVAVREALMLTADTAENPDNEKLGCTFRFLLPGHHESHATLDLIDAAGRRIRTLGIPSGAASLSWDGMDARGRPVTPGVYWARLRSGTWETSAKMIVHH